MNLHLALRSYRARSTEAKLFERVKQTFIHYLGRTLSYFGGCDYFQLSSHPAVLKAVKDGLKNFGLTVAASRTTTGNHPLYPKLERELASFFDAESALLLGNGYVTSLAVAQSLAGQFSHAMIDERAHVALQDAAQFLNCPVLKFKHRSIGDFSVTLKRCGLSARPIVLTDGMFAHDGSVAPLVAYLKLLPRDGLLVVDDAHGAGTLGKTGKGTLELENVNRTRVVQCVTLSKAFGVYGGAVLCTRALRKRIVERSSIFIGSTPLPLPLAHAVGVSLRVLKSDSTLRRRLNANARRVKAALRQTRFDPQETPGPIVSIQLPSAQRIARLKRALLAAGILPPFVNYPGSPAGGHFRFVISCEHTRKQLDDLVRTLVAFDANETKLHAAITKLQRSSNRQ